MATQEASGLLSSQNEARHPSGSSPTPVDDTPEVRDTAPAKQKTGPPHGIRNAFRLPPAVYEPLCYVPLLVSLAPLALILGFAGRLSHTLAEQACTPGGEFVVPLTRNIWNASAFFEITIPFVGSDPNSCSFSGNDPFENRDCMGYSFTEVKVVDLAWDVLVGRGGQALLVIFVYMLFSRVIVALMRRGQVSYPVFATVAFQTGTWTALWKLFWQAVRSTPTPRTRRAYWCYMLMLLTTAYVVAYPSLLSAMTGYTTRFRPFLRQGETFSDNGTLVNCYDSFLPVWGRLGTSYLEVERGMLDFAPPAAGVNVSAMTFENSDMWIAYYYTYKGVYDSCSKSLDISSCSAAQQNTTLTRQFRGQEYKIDVYSPMPGIIPYPDSEIHPSATTQYRHWLCGSALLIDSRGLLQSSHYARTDTEFEGEHYVGVCQADVTYAWGFSFLLTLTVAAMHLFFVLMMYTLWLVNRKTWKASDRALAPGVFTDAVVMVTQAQKQNGLDLDVWAPERHKEDIVKGKSGMSFQSDHGLRRRKPEVGESD